MVDTRFMDFKRNDEKLANESTTRKTDTLYNRQVYRLCELLHGFSSRFADVIFFLSVFFLFSFLFFFLQVHQYLKYRWRTDRIVIDRIDYYIRYLWQTRLGGRNKTPIISLTSNGLIYRSARDTNRKFYSHLFEKRRLKRRRV